MIEVIILAIALSMDAFAVAIGLGAKHLKNNGRIAFIVALYFGLFQGIMPLLGYLGGKGLLGWIEGYAKWIAFVLLFFIGGKMLYEAFNEKVEENINEVTNKVLLTLAIATSIDALAAGFSLNLLKFNPFISCGIIALTTFLFSFSGVHFGAKFGTKFESKAEAFGGVILILIALKMIIF